MRTIFLKTLYDKRWFLVGWSLGLAAVALLTVVFFTSFNSVELVKMLETIPESLKPLVGEVAAYSTIEGYIANGLFAIRLPMLFAPMVIILAVSLTVSEELSGKLYQLLAQPISRLNILMQKYWAGVAIVCMTQLVAVIAIVGGIIMINESVPWIELMICLCLSVMLSITLFSIAFGVGVFSGNRGITILSSVIVVFGGYLVTSFASQVSWLEFINYASLFYYYDPILAIRDGIPWFSYVLFVSVAMVFVWLGAARFSSRDIKHKD